MQAQLLSYGPPSCLQQVMLDLVGRCMAALAHRIGEEQSDGHEPPVLLQLFVDLMFFASAFKRLSAAQLAWAEYVADLDACLLAHLPGMWAIATSGKLDQAAADLPPALASTLSSAPQLAQCLVRRLAAAHSSRLATAWQALAQAGPLNPALELAT
ncbi:component of the exocyst complex, partial [Haematococcus lacustris]